MDLLTQENIILNRAGDLHNSAKAKKALDSSNLGDREITLEPARKELDAYLQEVCFEARPQSLTRKGAVVIIVVKYS